MSKLDAILVTGGAGFIGSHFVDLSLDAGFQVVVLDALTYAGHLENLEHVKKRKDWVERFEFVKGSICDKELIECLFEKHKFRAAVNFAAETHVDRSISGPGEFINTNIVGTFNLLRVSLSFFEKLKAADRERFRYLQVSTDEVFGSLGETGKFSESSPFTPNSPYSASKAGADHLVSAWYHTYGLPTITTHCSNNYGPRQYPEKLIPFMIDCALKGRPLGVYGDGKNVRDWIHVEDHCGGILKALEVGKAGNRYCFGGNEEWKNFDLVRLICSQLDVIAPRKDGKKHETAITFVQDRAGHDRRYAIDDIFAIRELGYKRTHTFQSGLASTVKWYVDNQQWCKSVLEKSK